MPSSRHSSLSPVCKPRCRQSCSSSHGRSRSTGDGDDRWKRHRSPSPPKTSDRTRGKRHCSRSRDDDCWGVHPKLPYITHSHSSRCSVCTEYGAHLTLASAAQLRTYQCAHYDLVHLQDRLLQHRSVEDMDRSSVMRRRTMRSCNRTTPVFRRKATNYRLVPCPWALPSPIQPSALLRMTLPPGHRPFPRGGHRSRDTRSDNISKPTFFLNSLEPLKSLECLSVSESV